MLGSERSSDLGWVRAEQLAATGRHLQDLPQTARRELAAAPAPAAPQATSPVAAPAAAPPASVDGRPCQAITEAAFAGYTLNFTSVEAFCLNQVSPVLPVQVSVQELAQARVAQSKRKQQAALS